ncbi:MAG: polysaccharide deacetylase family protein [Candidatus Poribacteria bacterium]|jgi:peptidoglycan/xylan/chitin deacetylase (PgdA/CDA1 family)
MFILTFDVESAYALNPSLESDKNWQIWLEETLTSITQITQILKRHEVPATFFIVGKVIERAGQDLVDLLDNNLLFDIGSHTYSHMGILSDNSEVLQQLDPELVKTSELILKYFGRKPLGFCAPGGFYRGLQGHPKQLGILWNHGHRFIRTDGVGPPEQPMPALFTQPYWHTQDGFPDLFEVPATGWHCNLLFNTGYQSDGWKPGPGFVDGTILERLPTTVKEGFQARRKEFQYAIDNNLIYGPAMHPWSVYRFDPELKHLEQLIEMAREKNVPIMNCRQLYDKHQKSAA